MATNGPIDEFDNLFPTLYPLSAIESMFNSNTPGDNDSANACTSAFIGYPENIRSIEVFDIPSQPATHSSPLKPILAPTAEPSDSCSPSPINESTPSKQTSATTTTSMLCTLNNAKIDSLVQQIQKETATLKNYQEKFDSKPLVAPSELSSKEQKTWIGKIKHKRSAQISRYKSSIQNLEWQLEIEKLKAENQALKNNIPLPSPISDSFEINQLPFEYLQAENLRLESLCKSLLHSNSELSQTATDLHTTCENLKFSCDQLKAENDNLKVGLEAQSEFLKVREAVASEQINLFMHQYQILANAHSQLQSDRQLLSMGLSASEERNKQMKLSFEEYANALVAAQTRAKKTVNLYKAKVEKSELEKKAQDVQFTDMQEQIQTLTRALESRNQRQACDDEIRIPAIEHARKREQATGWTPLSSYRTPQNTDETRLPHPRQQCGNFP